MVLLVCKGLVACKITRLTENCLMTYSFLIGCEEKYCLLPEAFELQQDGIASGVIADLWHLYISSTICLVHSTN